ncbi:MAG: serine/threonine-protein kinase [Gemmataceae bacterium]
MGQGLMMGESSIDRVQELFDQAVALPAAERTAFLTAACAGDTSLHTEVASLLAADAEFAGGAADALLAPALIRTPVSVSPGFEEPLPSRIGRYRIVSRIADGGMGVVYEAEQDSPRRLVALKIVRTSLDSPTLKKRLSHEAEILGRLQHPGIAQVYDAGIAEGGRPFFAMELIRGLPLDEYARARSLSVSARLGLVARVCDAVQYAHEQGVVHRDLKPANLLVDEIGQPKVVDFGVARVTDADLLTGPGLTRTGQLLGTPNYMSPEQVNADPAAVDHRCDVYALGVILFELLSFQLPFRLKNRPLAEVAGIIGHAEPPRLGSINAELRGDVETIVARALEKEPARRYSSAADLAADLRRYLAHEPILARPPSSLYQLRKFARRNTALVGGVAATGLALVLGLVGTILFAIGEAHQRGLAENNAEAARSEKRNAEFQAYRARLAAAIASLWMHDVVDAGRHLDAAPTELRDWEWRHLRSQLDDSTSLLPAPRGQSVFLIGAPNRLRFGAFSNDRLCITEFEDIKPTSLQLHLEGGNQVTAAQTRLGLRVAVWVEPTSFVLFDESGRRLCRVEMPKAKELAPVAFSPDGSRLASWWGEGKARRLSVFDSANGKLIADCTGHTDGIWDFTFSPDSMRLATASDDQTACVWNAKTGELLTTYRGHSSRVLSIAFRPDGQRLVTSSSDRTVRQWDAATGRDVEAPYDRHSGEVSAAAYSPDGECVASVGTDRTIRVWQAVGRQDIAALHGHTGPVVRLAFSSNGRRVASLSTERLYSGGDNTLRVWDVDPHAPLPVLRNHSNSVYPVAFSPDGSWLASGSWDKTVRLWDAATGEPCATLEHPGVVPSLAYSPDGTWLITGNYTDNRLRIWDTATTRVRKEIQGPAGRFKHVIVSPDGTKVAATGHEGEKHHSVVCDHSTGKTLFSVEERVLAYSPDGRWLAGLDADEVTVILRDARTHAVAARFNSTVKIHGAVFSPNSLLLGVCVVDHTVRLWEIDSGACRVLRGHTDEIFGLAFHPDGTRLATAGRDRVICLWDLTRGEEVARLQGHTSYVWSLSFSADGVTLASGSGDTTVRLWDTVPLKVRYQARREVEAARPDAVQLVARMLAEHREPAEVVSRLKADASLSTSLRRAAMQEVIRQGKK